MVIHAPSAFALALAGVGQAGHVAPVVVAQQHYGVVGRLQSLRHVSLHLFVDGPDLWPLLGRAAGGFGNDGPLVLENLAQQGYVALVFGLVLAVVAVFAAHGLVAVATHADGYQVFGVFGALNTEAEEVVDDLLVGLIVPRPVLLAVACPFLVVARHGLVVRRAHDDAHLVGSLAVERVVGIEAPSPHRRPHEVGLEAQQQLEHAGVEVVAAIVGAVGVLHPRGEAGGLVVEEYAAVTHGRLTVGVCATFYINALVVLDRHVGPPIPRRDANLPRQLVYAVDGAAAVGAGNDHLVAGGGYDVFLAFALQVFGVYHTEAGQAVDACRVAYGADNDLGVGMPAHRGLGAAHLADVGGQVAGGYRHALEVGRVKVDGYAAVVKQQAAARETHEPGGAGHGRHHE